MPRGCTVCLHEKVEEINTQLIKGEGPQSVAKRYGFNLFPVKRHKANHLAKLHGQAITPSDALSLLDKIKALELDAKRLGELAEETGDLKTALTAIKQIANILELVGKLTGELQSGSQTLNINVQMGPLPPLEEVTARLARLDTPEAAARRKWIAEGGPLPESLRLEAAKHEAIDAEFVPVAETPSA